MFTKVYSIICLERHVVVCRRLFLHTNVSNTMSKTEFNRIRCRKYLYKQENGFIDQQLVLLFLNIKVFLRRRRQRVHVCMSRQASCLFMSVNSNIIDGLVSCLVHNMNNKLLSVCATTARTVMSTSLLTQSFITVSCVCVYF